ncbi:MAG: hypothetical protein ABIU63_13750 [Chitinophagaceae bacterium]
MSEQLRHKMNDFEATPPGAAWKAIAAGLDDDTQYAALAAKMNAWQAAPTPLAWQAIAARLNDDKQYAALAAKMNSFDTVPPPETWTRIETVLRSQTAEPPALISNRRNGYRVAAAAIIACLLIGAWLFTGNKKNTAALFVKNNTAKALESATLRAVIQKTPSIAGNVTAAGTTKPAPDREPAQNKISSRVSTYEGATIKYAVVQSLPAYREGPIIITALPILDKKGAIIRAIDVLATNSNYLTVLGPNGQATRISSKFANVIGYLNGSENDTEEYIDRVIQESDTWKQRFHDWRSKISQSAFIPSAVNFFDIMAFKDLIQEKK